MEEVSSYNEKTKETHRGAIVRHEDPSFDEGKIIVRHFINEVFKIE